MSIIQLYFDPIPLTITIYGDLGIDIFLVNRRFAEYDIILIIAIDYVVSELVTKIIFVD